MALPPPWPWAQGTLGHNTHEAWHGPAAPGDVEACYPQPICTTTEHSCGKPKEKRAEETEEKTLKQVKNIQKAPKKRPKEKAIPTKKKRTLSTAFPAGFSTEVPKEPGFGGSGPATRGPGGAAHPFLALLPQESAEEPRAMATFGE